MKYSCLYSSHPLIFPFQKTVINLNCHNFPSNSKTRRRFPSRFTVNCRDRTGENSPTALSSSLAYAILGVDPSCSADFRAKVKQYHPDVNRDGRDSDTMIRRVIQAYGHIEDYQVQLAVGQCPRNCIHYVTPSQRIILEELLDSILNVPYDTSAEADLLYSLIVKAKFENNRYQKPKKQPKTSSQHVDWF